LQLKKWYVKLTAWAKKFHFNSFVLSICRFDSIIFIIIFKKSKDYLSRDFPQKYSYYCGYRAHGGFSTPQQYSHGLASRPRHRAYRAPGKQLPEPSTKGMHWGLPLQNSKVPVVPLVLSSCVVAMKSPHAPLLQFAPSLSFRFPVVMPFAGSLRLVFGGSPVSKRGYID
jgi:hypothetical protein